MYFIIAIDSFHDAITLFDEMYSKVNIWAFRGQINSEWSLATKFEREATKYVCDAIFFKNREKAILDDFKRKAHQYIGNLPAEDELIEWLSFIQHYGGPTRLLDFTFSCYVSLFFATDSPYDKINSSVWAININVLLEYLSRIEDDINPIDYDGSIKIFHRGACRNISDRTSKDCIYILEPYHQHERLAIQQGLFLYPGHIEKPFAFNLCKTLNLRFDNLDEGNAKVIDRSAIKGSDFSEIGILKIILPYDIHPTITEQLRQMNISSATLFPGLDGFARSLNYHFRRLEYLITRPMVRLKSPRK